MNGLRYAVHEPIYMLLNGIIYPWLKNQQILKLSKSEYGNKVGNNMHIDSNDKNKDIDNDEVDNDVSNDDQDLTQV